MKRGEVWLVAFDPAVDSESRKTLPAVIVSNDAANRHLARVIVIPMTSAVDRVYPGETIIALGGRQSKVMADQIMAADKRRLKTLVGVVAKADMVAIDDVIRVQLALAK